MANRGKTNVQRIFSVTLKVFDKNSKLTFYIPTTIIAESRKMLNAAIKNNAMRNSSLGSGCAVKLHIVKYEGRVDTYQ